MKRPLSIALVMMSSAALAAPQDASESLTLNVTGTVNAECSLIPEGQLGTVNATLDSGQTYRAEQRFQYGCNAPYKLQVKASHGKLLHVEAHALGKTIAIPYTLIFNSQPITLDINRVGVLAEVNDYQSLMPLQDHPGEIVITTPDEQDIVAGTYTEDLTFTLSSIL